MFIIRAPQKVYFNEFFNENIHYDIEKYYENFDAHYFADSFIYHINNKE